MRLTNDTPMLVHESAVRRLEVAAMTAYRAKYPAGPDWQELHDMTRELWMARVEMGVTE